MKPSTKSMNERDIYVDKVPVQFLGKDTTMQTYALLYSGSDRTFCEHRIVDELSLKLHISPFRVPEYKT